MVIIIAVRVAGDVLGAFRVAGAVVEFTERVAFKRAAVAVALVVVRAVGILAVRAFTDVVAFAIGICAGITNAFGTARVTATEIVTLPIRTTAGVA